MSGIDTLVTLIKLHVDSMYVPIKQKRRTFNDEKNQVVREEDEFLLKVDSIRELQFLEWIAKVVYVKNSNVKKSNGTWRICTNFTTLNKACPKDFYPLPCLARLVDGSAGHEVFDFMDFLQWYHQIKMYLEDEEKTAFITEYGLYCWKVMPFGLKNAGASPNSIFANQIGRNMEIYVDDMLVKSKIQADHLKNLRETSNQLRASKLRINLDKCSFGLTSGKFMGIEPNLDNIKAILDMQPLREYKDIQKLTGCLATLSQLISKSRECNLPFFKNLR
ncbi:hypothetical protein LIER_01260 [Lithospermum erythrorhizon]|uniref:Reverse transcriptase domain-containing protein n=1 Tax=Lithospermum erythrorhizon TaxID=34254 RepID=A0AAV3NK97_LITER